MHCDVQEHGCSPFTIETHRVEVVLGPADDPGRHPPAGVCPKQREPCRHTNQAGNQGSSRVPTATSAVATGRTQESGRLFKPHSGKVCIMRGRLVIHGPVPTGRTRWTQMDRCRWTSGGVNHDTPPISSTCSRNQDAASCNLVTQVVTECNLPRHQQWGGQEHNTHPCTEYIWFTDMGRPWDILSQGLPLQFCPPPRWCQPTIVHQGLELKRWLNWCTAQSYALDSQPV